MKGRRIEKNKCFQNPGQLNAWAFDSVHRGLVWGHLLFVEFNNLFVNH
jgi:hypothetical protein